MGALLLGIFKSRLQMEQDDKSKDAEFLELLATAKQTLKIELGYDFEEASPTAELHDPETHIYPKYRPIISVTSVEFQGAVLEADIHYFLYDNYIQFSGIDVTWGLPKSIKIAYKGGLLESDVRIRPYLDAVTQIAKETYTMGAEQNPMGIFKKDVSPELRILLDKLVDVRF